MHLRYYVILLWKVFFLDRRRTVQRETVHCGDAGDCLETVPRLTAMEGLSLDSAEAFQEKHFPLQNDVVTQRIPSW